MTITSEYNVFATISFRPRDIDSLMWRSSRLSASSSEGIAPRKTMILVSVISPSSLSMKQLPFVIVKYFFHDQLLKTLKSENNSFNIVLKSPFVRAQ